jgi:hypothetical protein
MVCNSCGRDNQNENSNFCEYCGASLREGVRPEVEPTTNYSYQNGTGYASAPVPPAAPAQAIEIDNSEKPVSVLNWIGTYLIMFIPIVGGLVFLIMLFVWASGGNNVPTSKKNWAKANLILMLISLIFVIVFIIFFFTVLRNSLDIFRNQIDGYNEFFDFNY